MRPWCVPPPWEGCPFKRKGKKRCHSKKHKKDKKDEDKKVVPKEEKKE